MIDRPIAIGAVAGADVSDTVGVLQRRGEADRAVGSGASAQRTRLPVVAHGGECHGPVRPEPGLARKVIGVVGHRDTRANLDPATAGVVRVADSRPLHCHRSGRPDQVDRPPLQRSAGDQAAGIHVDHIAGAAQRRIAVDVQGAVIDVDAPRECIGTGQKQGSSAGLGQAGRACNGRADGGRDAGIGGNRRCSAGQCQRIAAGQRIAVAAECQVVDADRRTDRHRAAGPGEDRIVSQAVVPYRVRTADTIAVRAPAGCARIPDAGPTDSDGRLIRVPIPLFGKDGLRQHAEGRQEHGQHHARARRMEQIKGKRRTADQLPFPAGQPPAPQETRQRHPPRFSFVTAPPLARTEMALGYVFL